MRQDRAIATREKIVQTASELIRRKGYTATRIDDVCEAAGITKGAFFHHFKSKEELAAGCLAVWAERMPEWLHNAPFQKAPTAKKRVLGAIDLFIKVFDDPETFKSCLVGTTVQETADTNPELREVASHCFAEVKKVFQGLLDAACAGAKPRVDTGSLADFWIAAIQGSLIVYKASRDPSVIRKNLQHVKQYIAGHLPD